MNSLKIKTFLLFVCLLGAISAFAHVFLKSPVGGETFNPGEYVKIEWEETVAHNTKNWDLYFSTDGGKTYEALELDMNVKTLTFDWAVPYRSTKNARIKIVQDNVEGDYSDESGDFTIAGTTTASSGSLEHFKFQLFPNPAENQVHLSTFQPIARIKNIMMADITGRMVNLPISIEDEGKNQFNLDITKYTPGIYYLVLFIGEGTEVRKLVIQ